MTRHVVTFVSNNDGGVGALIHDSLDEAKDWARGYFFDLENDPTPSSEELIRFDNDLSAVSLHTTPVEAVRGSDAWKEWVYFAVLEPNPAATVPTSVLDPLDYTLETLVARAMEPELFSALEAAENIRDAYALSQDAREVRRHARSAITALRDNMLFKAEHGSAE